jgi:ubiquinol-cytochrome c reductase cytochrome c subunit
MTRIGMFVLLAGLGASLAAVEAGPKGSAAERGKATYIAKGCARCHGTVGQGGGFGAARLAPDPLPLDALTQFIRGATGPMPAYGPAILSDAELADIHAYLAAIPPPPAVSTVPALKDLKDGF